MKFLKFSKFALWLPIGLPIALFITGCVGTLDQRADSAVGSVTDNPKAEVNTKRGIGYIREGKYGVALEVLNEAVEADSNYATAHNALGWLHDKLGNPELAEKHFKRSMAINPRDSSVQNNYGSFLCRRGRIEDAVEKFIAAADNALYERPELAYTNAGVCLRTGGELSRAEGYFRQALTIQPKLTRALLNMAELSFTSKKYLSSRGYLQRFLEVSPHNSRSLWLGVRVEHELGDEDTVASYAMLLRANHPDSRETQLLLESGIQ